MVIMNADAHVQVDAHGCVVTGAGNKCYNLKNEIMQDANAFKACSLLRMYGLLCSICSARLQNKSYSCYRLVSGSNAIK